MVQVAAAAERARRPARTVRGRGPWVALAVAALLGVAIGAAADPLMQRIDPPSEDEMGRFEQGLEAYLAANLGLQETAVVADTSLVSVSFAASSDEREELVSQTTLVALHVGVAAPWAQNVRIVPQVGGYPTGVVTVSVNAIRQLANGQINDEAFYRTWQTEIMMTPFSFPAELLEALGAADPQWTVQERTPSDGLSVLVAFGLPEAHERLPENHLAAIAAVQTPQGPLRAAVIDVGNAAGAARLLEAVTADLGGQAMQAPDGSLQVTAATPITIRRDGGLVYIVEAPAQQAAAAISALLQPPTTTAGGVTQIATGGTTRRPVGRRWRRSRCRRTAR